MIRRVLAGLFLDAVNRVLSELGYRLVKSATMNGAPKSLKCPWCGMKRKPDDKGPVCRDCLPKPGDGAWPEGWMS